MNEPEPLTATLLGTGTSTGIPIAGCGCEVCTSHDPRDSRLRCACWVRTGGLSILIDAGPDLRRQCLDNDIRQVDALLLTHEHFDHVAGLDDLRPFLLRNRSPLPCFARNRTAEEVSRRFDYIFEDGSYPGVPNLELWPVKRPVMLFGRYGQEEQVEVTPIPVYHGELAIVGYRIGSFAYLTDVSSIPESSFGLLEDLNTLVLSALQRKPHPTHFSIDEAVEAACRINADKTYFIHMTHTVLHERDEARLPESVYLGYDGLQLEIDT